MVIKVEDEELIEILTKIRGLEVALNVVAAELGRLETEFWSRANKKYGLKHDVLYKVKWNVWERPEILEVDEYGNE